jgi:tetratricopeptide (TPR) repeat protein
MTRDCRSAVLLIVALVATAAPGALAQGAQQQGSTSGARLEPTTTSAAAKAEFLAGIDDWQVGAFTTAEKRFHRAIALDSSFGLAHVFAGAIPPRSLEALRSAHLDRGVALAARASTVEGLIALAWREKARNGFQRSAQLLHDAMQLLPDEPRLAHEYVWSVILSSNWKSALDSVRVFRKRFPSFPALYAPHSLLLAALGDSAEALSVAEEYARLAPQLPASTAFYGRALKLRGRFAEAEAQYRRSLSHAPAHPDYPADARSSLAELSELQGRTVEARTIAMEGIARATDAADSALYMSVAAGTSILAGDHRQALSLLASAREKSGFTGNTSLLPVDGLLAVANAIFGDRRVAPTHLARLPLNAIDSSNALIWHAVAYGYAGQLDSALAYADHLTRGATPETRSRTTWAHAARGLAYREKRQCAKALDELRQSDSTLVEVQAARADCESQLGNGAAAMVWRDRVLARRELRLIHPGEMYARARMKQMK